MSTQAGRPSPRQLSVESDGLPYPTVRYFNRYRVEKLDDAFVVHVATVLPDAPISETFSFAIGHEDIRNVAESTEKYLDKIPVSPSVKLRTGIIHPSTVINFANILNCSYSGKSAEIALSAYAIKATADASRTAGATKVKSQGVAILRSPLDIHVELLLQMFK